MLTDLTGSSGELALLWALSWIRQSWSRVREEDAEEDTQHHRQHLFAEAIATNAVPCALSLFVYKFCHNNFSHVKQFIYCFNMANSFACVLEMDS